MNGRQWQKEADLPFQCMKARCLTSEVKQYFSAGLTGRKSRMYFLRQTLNIKQESFTHDSLD